MPAANYDTPERFLDVMNITQCIQYNALCTDLRDAAEWKSTYWPDAAESHIWYEGNAHAFVDHAVSEVQPGMQTMWHSVGAVSVRVDGNSASAISYYLVHFRSKSSSAAAFDAMTGGRNFDELEKRNGIWKITRRHVKPDWTRKFENAPDWNVVVRGAHVHYGIDPANDPAQAFLAQH